MSPYINISAATVLITGGSDGIGRALAARFVHAGSTVVVTGRDEQKLASAAQELPGLRTLSNDLSQAQEREQLAAYVRASLPDLTILINNAGFQRRIALATDTAPWEERQAEIDTLFAGPVHLNHLVLPVLLAHRQPSLIVNVTSGGAYIPQPFAPLYSASQAALHSYTMNLRYALAQTPCRVVEVIPPAVQTALAGPGTQHGVPLDEFSDAIFAALSEGTAAEVGYGATASPAFVAAQDPYRTLFEQATARNPVTHYA
ncbi:MAG TPA: SDR family NAD(P)-dependent oxidoreductase [Ktedonobacteraceae bacterium]